MKDFLIVYSSKTGNTEKVAKKFYEVAGERCYLAAVKQVPAVGACGCPSGIFIIVSISFGSIAPRIDKVPTTLHPVLKYLPALANELIPCSE